MGGSGNIRVTIFLVSQTGALKRATERRETVSLPFIRRIKGFHHLNVRLMRCGRPEIATAPAAPRDDVVIWPRIDGLTSLHCDESDARLISGRDPQAGLKGGLVVHLIGADGGVDVLFPHPLEPGLVDHRLADHLQAQVHLLGGAGGLGVQL